MNTVNITIFDIVENKPIFENMTLKQAAEKLGTKSNYLSRAKQNNRVFKKRYKILETPRPEKIPEKSPTDLELEYINLCIWLRNRISPEQLKKIQIVPRKEPA